jgi:uncharacterized membrane protein HdeD (DUF308 family)
MRSAPWWLFLITGVLWMIIGLIVLRFDFTSVASIAALAGAVVLVAAIAEGLHTFTAPGWRWLHGLLAVLFLALAIVIFANPGRSFAWMAAFIGWYLLFKGFADIVLSFLTKTDNEAWWLLLIVGILEVLLGFWAAGRFERSAYLLIVYVAAIAIFRAVTDIVMAFRVRRLIQRP